VRGTGCPGRPVSPRLPEILPVTLSRAHPYLRGQGLTSRLCRNLSFAPVYAAWRAAAASSQIIAVSHAQTLINALHHATEEAGIPASTIELIKDFGETRVAGREPFDGPAWRWPRR
jgi:hypothetical protein